MDMNADTLSTPEANYSATPAQHTAARIIGIIYPIQMATGIFGEVFVRGQLIAGATPQRPRKTSWPPNSSSASRSRET
jgi:hypothetical protein